MTPLDRLVRETIERSGPLSIATFMDLVLNHPAHGYYASRRPIGAAGDFTTAPEVSQMFGELIGVWARIVRANAGCDEPFALVEIGPGRGTLCADIARALSDASGFEPTLHLIETSPSLRAEQRETLREHDARWHDTFAAFALAVSRPFVLVANELLDALPVRQFQMAGHWRERMVVEKDGALIPALGPPGELAIEAPDGTVLEVSPAREAIVAEVADAIVARGGAALFIDYGSLDGGFGDTLQAVSAHETASPFEGLGKADLTTHVDFQALANCARGVGCAVASTTQGEFLLELGLLERAGRLGHAYPERQERIRGEVERLAAPGEMGELFKVMALWHPEAERPPGFHPSA